MHPARGVPGTEGCCDEEFAVLRRQKATISSFLATLRFTR
jgi:hypothetical protein